MKRLIPLWITALGGFVLIVAYFIPFTQGWGEVAAIWFDILAAIAFLLGGGNLLKIHLKKVSDQAAGWGYSVITVVAFLTMLGVGLLKWGSPPAPNQEFYGETFARVPLASVPPALTFEVPGSIPAKADGEPVHASVRRQIEAQDGRIVFRGWMLKDQKAKLLEHKDQLEWKCAVEQLHGKAQPPDSLKRGDDSLVAYYGDHQALSFRGRMSEAQRDELKALRDADATWQAAVDDLYGRTQGQTSVRVGALPPHFDPRNPGTDLVYDPAASTLTVTGPLTPSVRDDLAETFPAARPLDEAGRDRYIQAVRALGPLHHRQEEAARAVLMGLWTVDDLVAVLDGAGAAQVVPRKACEMRKDQEDRVAEIEKTKTVDDDLALDEAQIAALLEFAGDPTETPDDLWAKLEAAGPVKDPQKDALTAFLATNPTEGELGKAVAFAMLKSEDETHRRLSLNQAQRDHLLGTYRDQVAWRQDLGRLFIAAHTIKYPWSGEYRAQGTPFWWLYEYAFKPLQATIFAMLAFYVASAAFRAFRAKNIEAMLLLGTAFIILLGRTFAGVFLTGWMPDELSGLRIEELTVTIMKVFNTAGNRAIMIGIALGIASTSLKVLLGVDRSYLGSGED